MGSCKQIMYIHTTSTNIEKTHLLHFAWYGLMSFLNHTSKTLLQQLQRSCNSHWIQNYRCLHLVLTILVSNPWTIFWHLKKLDNLELSGEQWYAGWSNSLKTFYITFDSQAVKHHVWVYTAGPMPQGQQGWLWLPEFLALFTKNYNISEPRSIVGTLNRLIHFHIVTISAARHTTWWSFHMSADSHTWGWCFVSHLQDRTMCGIVPRPCLLGIEYECCMH